MIIQIQWAISEKVNDLSTNKTKAWCLISEVTYPFTFINSLAKKPSHPIIKP